MKRISAMPTQGRDVASEDAEFGPRAGGESNSAVQDRLQASGIGDGVAEALEACFGAGIGRVSLDANSTADARSVGAEAYTIGNTVDMGGHDLDGDDPHAMELLGHEMSHAMADGGSGEELLSRKDDPGERIAEQAGKQFKVYAERGFIGSAPQLRPAHGGRAGIHRFESAEHMDAVDGAQRRLREHGDPELTALADSAAGLMSTENKIVLGNGVEMTPGEITALMGDFYGIFDEETGALDVNGSFEQLWNGDPEEAADLLAILAKEQRGEEISHTEWERALGGRDGVDITWTDPETGEAKSRPQQGMLEMAKHNDSHFSGATMAGTDNNMGVYTAFHERALLEAGCESPNVDMVRALEASGMHYLTDRHAGGHAFEKGGVMEASGYKRDGNLSNAFVKEVHDTLNASGPVATNARGEHFRTFGDGAWDEEGNASNRLMTAVSAASSFAEVQRVLDGNATPETLATGGFAAHSTVPAFEGGLQDDAEAAAKGRDVAGVSKRMATQYGPPLAMEALDEHVATPAREAERSFNRDWTAWEQWLIDGGVF